MPLWHRSPTTYTVLVIPADPQSPCRQETISTELMDGIHALIFRSGVQGLAERAQYDLDAMLFVDMNGAARRLPVNQRATEYAFEHSEAAQQHGTRGLPHPYWLYGDIVLVGCDPETSEPVPTIPARFETLFRIHVHGQSAEGLDGL